MQTIYDIDFAILDALQKIHCTFLNYLLAFFTHLGTAGGIWVVTAIVLLVMKKTRKAGFTMALALIFELAISEKLIKHLVKRPRPYTLRPEVDTFIKRLDSYSFPSGHTCASFAAATVIFYYNKKAGIAAYITAFIIGFSRNYFYMHFPTDVLCGAIEGVLFGLLAIFIVNKISEALKKRSAAKESAAPAEDQH